MFPICHAVSDELKHERKAVLPADLRYKLFLPTEKELIKELKTELELYNQKKMA